MRAARGALAHRASRPSPPTLTVHDPSLNNAAQPFGQRVWLTLLESGTAFDYVETAIAKGEKTPEFTAAYKAALGADPASDGKVPVLEELDAAGAVTFSVTESAVVADYVAARAGGALLPATPAERARAGIWAEQSVAPFVKAFYALLMHRAAHGPVEAKAAALADAARAAGAALAPCGGPFLLGARLTTADLMLAPFVLRLCTVRHYRGFELPTEGADAQRFLAFVAAISARESVKATTPDDAFFIEGYKGYAVE